MCSICDAVANGFTSPRFGHATGDAGFAAFDGAVVVERILAPEIFSQAENAFNKPTRNYDSAGAQITRTNSKFDDGDFATGNFVGAVFDSNALGTPGRVTYGYLSDGGISTSGRVGTYAESRADHRAFTTAELSAVEYSMRLISDVASIRFDRVVGVDGVHIESDSAAQMVLMAEIGTNGGWAVNFRSQGDISSALVNIGERNLEVDKSYAFQTAIHEVGHAIGLSHPGNYNGSAAISYGTNAEYFEDSRQFSLMSYWSETSTGASFGSGRYPTGPMLHDIAALQRLYGLNTTSRAENTIYGFNSNTNDTNWTLSANSDFFIAAIWDAGGIDTIDLSGYVSAQLIDLRPESFSSSGGMRYNLSIARGVRIENAIGGAGNDLLIGNAADASFVDAKYLTYAGIPLANAVFGYDGNNLLDGGAGVDTVSYADATDRIDLDLRLATDGVDLGGNGRDTLRGVEAIIGTNFADRLHGDGSQNNLQGGLGDDTIGGGDGADLLDGGAGIDTLDLSSFTVGVRLNLVPGLILITDAAGAVDTVSGFENSIGSAFDDELIGAEIDNALEGAGANDTLVGFDGNDVLLGGDGDDLLVGDDLPGVYEPVATTFFGTAGDDTLIGNGFGNVIEGLAGNDRIEGLAGNDTLRGGAGNDTVEGGDGDDVISVGVADAADRNLLLGGTGADTIDGGLGADTLTGEAGDDSLRGDAGADEIDGGDGHDRLLGGADNDLLTGGLGTDTLDGGDGDDTLSAGDGDDDLAGGAGQDSLSGGAGRDLAEGGADADIIEGAAGSDTLRGGDGNDTIDGGDDSDTIEGGEGADLIMAGAGLFDFAIGDAGDDTIFGGEGDNYLVGGTGTDSIIGGVDYDYIASGEGADILDGGNAGPNGLWYVNSAGGVEVDLGAGIFRFNEAEGDTAINFTDVYGSNAGVDTLTGDAGDNRVEGWGGDDTLAGAAGADTVLGGEGDDTIDGGEGDDLLRGDGGSDSLVGGDGADTLDARVLDNTSITGAIDTLVGGAGADLFVLGGDVEGARIADFVDGEDLIDLSSVLGVAAFTDLQFVADAGGTRIFRAADPTSGTPLAEVLGVDAQLLDAADFVFASSGAQLDFGRIAFELPGTPPPIDPLY